MGHSPQFNTALLHAKLRRATYASISSSARLAAGTVGAVCGRKAATRSLAPGTSALVTMPPVTVALVTMSAGAAGAVCGRWQYSLARGKTYKTHGLLNC